MLSICIESAATRLGAPGGAAASMAAPMTSAALPAYGAQHMLLPTSDARGGVQGSQCAWDPPV